MRDRAKECENQCNLKVTIQMIDEALNLGKGMFYKCQSGHLFVINEYSPAIEEFKCNECGATIIGGNHSLA